MKGAGLILVGGNVASGKTTVSKALALSGGFVFLDKDQVGEPLIRALMKQLSGNPMDRDSEIYINTVRALSYKSFLGLLKVFFVILRLL